MHDADRQPKGDILITVRLGSVCRSHQVMRIAPLSRWAVLVLAWTTLGGLVACGGRKGGQPADGSAASGGSVITGSGGDSSKGGSSGASTGGAGVVSTGGSGSGATGGNPGDGGGGAGRSTGGASAGESIGQGGGGAPEGGASGQPVQMTLASLPTPRQEHGVAALLGEVYVLGGYTPNVTSSVMAYDPTKDTWRSVADFPSPFNHPAAGVIDDQIYVGGFYAGTSLTGPADGRTYVYDPKADAWSQRQSLPSGTERAGGCVAIVGKDMYVFGGGNSGQATNLVSVYHSAEDRWEVLPPLPETREHCDAFPSGDKLYIASGRTHTIPEFRPTTLEYDPAAQTYATKTPIPTPRGGAAGAVMGGRLFLFGGEGADNTIGVFSEIQAYDATHDSWETFPPMTMPRHGFGAATVGDRIYLPGGATRQGGSATNANTVFYFE
ncbi:MAG TPA: kelch repeat-containing protein [Polyangia bacterium]|jgi:N-acetylneuraminic acid mutarotase